MKKTKAEYDREYYLRNRDKLLAQSLARYAKTGHTERYRSLQRSRTLKSKYGITSSEYDSMFMEQGGRCALCRQEPERKLEVDHHHESGQVRKLLCRKCNTLVGFVETHRLLIPAVFDYLG